ncbi:MAG: hypothetical protein E6Q98_15885 [Rhodospirillaceae bacterium]|nr:MAG: hypothetical protein E6Q98_15885 [Rhodospirillaceae bacterium]
MKSKVYFIRFGVAGPIKIGHSTNLPGRMSHLRIAHHEEPVVLAMVPGGAMAEKMLHIKFAAEHMKGEWFAPSDKLLTYISEVESLGHLPEDKATADKLRLDQMIATAGLDNELILFRHHLAACLRKRLYPHSKWSALAFSRGIGMDMKSVGNWLRASHEPKASTLLRIHRFFSAAGDTSFLTDVYSVDLGKQAKAILKSTEKAMSDIDIEELQALDGA